MGSGSTTILDKVRALVTRLSPEPICDACIARTLGFPNHHDAGRETRALAGGEGFERRIAACSLCLETRTVIRHR